MPFYTPLDVRAYAPGEFALLEPFKYRCKLDYVVMEITVPRNFITDFASIPWAVQVLPGFDVNGGSRMAAVIHDYLYCHQGHIEVGLVSHVDNKVFRSAITRLNRASCDDILRMALLDTGLDECSRETIDEPFTETQAWLYWAGVRIGGWTYWNKRRGGPNPDDFVSNKEAL